MRLLIAAVTTLILVTVESAGALSLEKAYVDLCSDLDKAKGEACATLAEALATRSRGHGAEPASMVDMTSAAGHSAEPAVSPASADLERPEIRIKRATRFFDQLAGRAWTNGVIFYEFAWQQRGVSLSMNLGSLGTYSPSSTRRIEINPTTGVVSLHGSVLSLFSGERTERLDLAGEIGPDGVLRMEPLHKDARGAIWRIPSPDHFEWAWNADTSKKPFLISEARWAEYSKAGAWDLWATDLAKAHAQKQREIEAVAAQQNAVRSQERAAQRASQEALYNVLKGELAVATESEAESRANMDATLAQVNAQAAAQREAEAQAQRQVSGQQRAVQIPSAPTLPPPPARPERSQVNGVLTVESVPQAGSVRPTPVPAKNSGEEFIYCVVLRSGDFDGHKRARFFSEIAPITVDYGRPLDGPPRAFLAEVKAAYSLSGGSPFCSTNMDRATLERMRQEDFDSDVFRSHKNVMTNIVPRD